jgi:hypothetical protein
MSEKQIDAVTSWWFTYRLLMQSSKLLGQNGVYSLPSLPLDHPLDAPTHELIRLIRLPSKLELVYLSTSSNTPTGSANETAE